jgi:hypothetical protein
MNYIILILFKHIWNEIPLLRIPYIQYEFGVNSVYLHSRKQEERVERIHICAVCYYEQKLICLLLYLHGKSKFRPCFLRIYSKVIQNMTEMFLFYWHCWITHIQNCLDIYIVGFTSPAKSRLSVSYTRNHSNTTWWRSAQLWHVEIYVFRMVHVFVCILFKLLGCNWRGWNGSFIQHVCKKCM